MKRLVKKNKVNDMFAAIIKAMLYSYKKNNSNIKIADLYEEDDYELKLINALDDLTDYNDTEPIVKLLPLIRQNNPESLYNGTVYRKYFFDKNILNNANVTFNEEVTEMYISRSELENVIRSQIRTGKPQSTTKSLESCHIFNLTDIDTPLEVTTQFEAKDGIDIVALSENFLDYLNEFKYIDEQAVELCEILKSLINWYGGEQEIFVEVSNDYKIIEIRNRDIDDYGDPLSYKEMIYGKK